MKAIVKVFFLLIICSSSHGQSWTKNISNNSYSSSNSIIILDDTLFISDNSLTDAGIIKLNNLGQFSSGKKFNNILRFSSLIRTNDNNIIAIGNTSAPSNDIIVLKLSKSLNLIWSYQLSLSNYQFPEAVIENSNGGYTICGFTSLSEGDQSSRNGLVLKLSNSGSLDWSKTISKSGSDYFSGLTEGPSGKILLTGVTTGNVLDISLVQISSSGNLLNSASWGGTGNDGGYSAIFKNGKYYVSGNSWSAGAGMQDMILLKFDTLLNKEFSIAYGSSNIEPGLLLKTTNNGKLILAGQSYGINTPNKGRDVCVLFLNDDGSIISMKNIGGSLDEFIGYGYNFIEEYNNDFYVVGSIPYSSSKCDILLSKINSTSIDSCCNTINELTFTSTTSSIDINITNDLTTNTILNSIPYTNLTFNTIYNLDTVCLISSTPLSTSISTIKNVFCQNEIVQFNGSANLSNVQYSWNFNDPISGSSNISNSQNTSHIFSNPGIYNIILKAKNACKEAYDTLQITIEKSNSYKISTLPKLIYCIGDTVKFNTTTTDSTAHFTWNFDDPSSGSNDSSNLLNPYHIFTAEGNYTISLKANLPCSLQEMDTISITILTDTLNIYFKTHKLTYCKNEPIVLSYYINDNSSITDWFITDLSSGNQTSITNNANPILTISDTGLVKIVIRTRNQCGFDSDSIIITIIDNPWIQPSISSNNLSICMGDTAYFSAIADTLNRKYYWTFGEPNLGNGDTSKLYQPYHIYNTAGIFLVIFRIENDCGVGSDSLYVTVNSPSNLNLKIANTQFSYCIGSNVTFTITTSNTNAPVLWDFDDPLSGNLNSSTSRNPIHKFNTAGIYSIKVYSSYLCSSDTDSITIVITDFIDLNASIQNNLPGCVKDTVQFNAISADLNCVVYWDFGDPSSGTNNNSSNKNPKHLFTAPGIYMVSLLSINNCEEERDTLYIEIKNPTLPQIAISIDSCSKIVQLRVIDINQNNFNWFFNDSIISTDSANFILTNGINSIKLIINQNSICVDSIIEEITSQEFELFNESEIPNVFTPNNDGINDYYKISKNHDCEVRNLAIYNRWGAKVYESSTNLQWDGKYNGRDCDQGNYIAYIELSNKKIVKFINLLR